MSFSGFRYKRSGIQTPRYALFQATTLHTTLPVEMVLRCLRELPMNRANYPDLIVLVRILDHRIVVLIAVLLSRPTKKGTLG
jgi:hypothetical protein